MRSPGISRRLKESAQEIKLIPVLVVFGEPTARFADVFKRSNLSFKTHNVLVYCQISFISVFYLKRVNSGNNRFILSSNTFASAAITNGEGRQNLVSLEKVYLVCLLAQTCYEKFVYENIGLVRCRYRNGLSKISCTQFSFHHDFWWFFLQILYAGSFLGMI